MVSTAREPRSGVGDIKRVLAVLEPHFDLVHPGPITSRDHAESAARRFRAECAELLILMNMMWTEDGPLASLLGGPDGGLDGVPGLAGGNPMSIVPEVEYQAVDEVEGAWVHFAA